MIKFKDFVTAYTNELWKQESLGEPAEPIEVCEMGICKRVQ